MAINDLKLTDNKISVNLDLNMENISVLLRITDKYIIDKVIDEFLEINYDNIYDIIKLYNELNKKNNYPINEFDQCVLTNILEKLYNKLNIYDPKFANKIKILNTLFPKYYNYFNITGILDEEIFNDIIKYDSKPLISEIKYLKEVKKIINSYDGKFNIFSLLYDISYSNEILLSNFIYDTEKEFSEIKKVYDKLFTEMLQSYVKILTESKDTKMFSKLDQESKKSLSYFGETLMNIIEISENNLIYDNQLKMYGMPNDHKYYRNNINDCGLGSHYYLYPERFINKFCKINKTKISLLKLLFTLIMNNVSDGRNVNYIINYVSPNSIDFSKVIITDALVNNKIKKKILKGVM